MKPTIKNIKSLAKQRKVIRGIDLFELPIETLNNICDICVDEVQTSVLAKLEPEWNSTWKSIRVLNEEEAKKNHKAIPRLDTLVEVVTENLQRSSPVKVSMTRNVGPEYCFYASKKNDRDYSDWVHVPEPYRFSHSKYFYKIYFHELGHAACSRNRLCLKFGSMDEEEVTVDTIAMILCFLSGVNVWNDSIAYSQDRSYDLTTGELCVRTARQWRSIRSKVKRILKFLLTGRLNPTGLTI